MEFKLKDCFSGVRIVSSERRDGSMNYNLDKGKNLVSFANRSGIKKAIAYGEQVHKSKIKVCSGPGQQIGADGVCSRGELALAVKSADCLPLMFFEPQSGVLGGLHISRHNIITGIIDNLAELLKAEGVDFGSTAIFLGPHIRKESYKLSEKAFKEISISGYKSFIDSEGKFDLTRAVISSLEQNGFLEENIDDCGIDTFSSPDFFSYRSDHISGGSLKVFVTIISRDV